jgi:hypothetical protein
MPQQSQFIVAPWPEPSLAKFWGVQCLTNSKWLPVLYASKVEAEAVVYAMQHPADERKMDAKVKRKKNRWGD